jgi:hypothetical protein
MATSLCEVLYYKATTSDSHPGTGKFHSPTNISMEDTKAVGRRILDCLIYLLVRAAQIRRKKFEDAVNGKFMVHLKKRNGTNFVRSVLALELWWYDLN